MNLYRSEVPQVVDPYVHSDTSLIQQLIDNGSLVPVEPCEHGNIYGHIIGGQGSKQPWVVMDSLGDPHWCDGAGLENEQ